MDTLQNLIANGPISYFLQEKTDPDLEAWATFHLLPPPCTAHSTQKLYFNIDPLDQMIGGLSGLWDIHGGKGSGKSFLCRCLAGATQGRVLYFGHSAINCEEAAEGVTAT
jgi:hypothetical protein